MSKSLGTLLLAGMLAVTGSARVAKARAKLKAAEARAIQAGVRPNPEVSVGVENFSGTGPYRTFRSTETTVSVTQPFELGGKRRAREEVAAAERDYAQIVLTARADGAIRRINRRLGDFVSAGEAVALMESRDAAAIGAERSSAAARLALARSTYAREKKLFDARIVERSSGGMLRALIRTASPGGNRALAARMTANPMARRRAGFHHSASGRAWRCHKVRAPARSRRHRLPQRPRRSAVRVSRRSGK